jgi:hypothetical protein
MPPSPASNPTEALKLLAASESVRLEVLGPQHLAHLEAVGWVQRDERPKQASLEARYESLQETHRLFLEARACVDRLQRRHAPRSMLGGLLFSPDPPKPGKGDPDALALLELLEALRIQIRGLEGPGDVPKHLTRILDHLQVEGRECLDRLADTDRELEELHRHAPAGTRVEPEGYYTLTAAGEASLPEAPVWERFEGVLQGAFGPLAARSLSAPHLRQDPASFLALLMEGQVMGFSTSSQLAEYESLLDAFTRIPTFTDNPSLRARSGFLVRLLRASRGEPKRAFYWCHRERLQALLTRTKDLVPPSVAGSGWHLPYAADLFLSGGGLVEDEAQHARREALLRAVLQVQAERLQSSRIGDGQSVRLALALAHAARARNFSPGILMDRFLGTAFDMLTEAVKSAPYDLGDGGTRMLFALHMAHAADFKASALPERLEAFSNLRTRLLEPELGESAPVRTAALHGVPHQVQLHLFATSERLRRLGLSHPPEALPGLLARLRKRLSHHKVASRAFRHEQVLPGDEAALASNLAALTCFQGVQPPPGSRFEPDAGVAGLYEGREAGRPPLLGASLGTLMLA